MKPKPKQAAGESTQVQRAREKLKAQLSEERKQFNPERLKAVTEAIVGWLERHSRDRVPLPGRVALWDSNRHTAGVTSDFVFRLQSALNPGTKKPTDESE